MREPERGRSSRRGHTSQTVAILASVIALLSAQAAAQDNCGSLYPADPAALAAELLPELERLYAGIPALSPREEQWLDEEMAASADRAKRAISSREHALREAKIDAGSLLGVVRQSILKGHNQAELTKGWIRFAHTLIDDDSSLYLAGLVAEKVIQREAIPEDWTLWEGASTSLQNSIRWGRIGLARHVLICTLPSVLGISVYD